MSSRKNKKKASKSKYVDPVLKSLLQQGVDLGFIDNSEIGEMYRCKKHNHTIKKFFGCSLALIFLYFLLVKLIGLFND